MQGFSETGHPGNLLLYRYWGKDLPVYKDVAATTLRAAHDALEMAKNPAITTQEVEQLQQCLAVAVQILLPPMRGKPYETLELTDHGNNSVPRPPTQH